MNVEIIVLKCQSQSVNIHNSLGGCSLDVLSLPLSLSFCFDVDISSVDEVYSYNMRKFFRWEHLKNRPSALGM